MFVDEGSEIGFDGNLFTHRTSAADGWLVLECIESRITIPIPQPLHVLVALTKSRRIGILPEKVQHTIFGICGITGKVGERIRLKV